MKKLFKILITLSLVFMTLNANEANSGIGTSESPFGEVDLVQTNVETKDVAVEASDVAVEASDVAVETNDVAVEASDVAVETNDVAAETNDVVDNNTSVSIDLTSVENDSIYSDDDFETSNEDINESIQAVTDMSAFEKLFVNHSAYIYYSKGVEELYKSNYKSAYENAMKAKEIIDNTDNINEQIIALPYMPSFVRETAYSPKRIYYKIVKAKVYELRKLIVKAKLISPPIASVIVKKTSTYMEIIIRNFGDLPLDEFELLINEKSMVKYDKILPNDKKTIRVDIVEEFHEISFKEKYGFAPSSIMLSEDE